MFAADGRLTNLEIGFAAPTLPPHETVYRPNCTMGTDEGWTSEALEALLRTHGPLWCATSHNTGNYGHAVVVKGITAQDQVILHDPTAGENLHSARRDFNDRLTWKPNCVMYLPATADHHTAKTTS